MQLTLHRRAARAALHPAPQSDQGSWGGGEVQTQSGGAVYETEMLMFLILLGIFGIFRTWLMSKYAYKSLDFEYSLKLKHLFCSIVL